MNILDRQSLVAMSLKPKASMEARQDELEHMFIGRLEDLSVLEGVESEHQVQWDLKLNEDPRQKVTMRVRCIDDEKYILCIKKKNRGDACREEIEVDSDKNIFDIIKSIATSGMRKRRYFFPVQDADLVWELDVFEDAGGNPTGWVKLDLEIPSIDTPIPDFPVKLTDIVHPGDQEAIDRTMDEKIVLRPDLTQ